MNNLSDIMNNLPDNGGISEYNTGAIRDKQLNKGIPSMIPTESLRKIARRYEDGANKYGPNNWQLGIPLSRYYDAIFRHLLAWGEGKTDEDHLGAIGWNMCSAAWTQEQIEKGLLPAELNDLSFHPQKFRA